MKKVGLLTIVLAMMGLIGIGVVAQDESPQHPVITPENVTQIQELRMLGRGNAFETVFSPDGNILAVASSIGIWLYDFNDLEAEPRFLEGHTRDVISIDFSPDGRFIASGSHDETLRIWDVATGEMLRLIEMPKDLTQEYSFSPVYDLAYSPDGRFIVTGCGAEPLYIWEAQTGEQVKALTGHNRSIRNVTYSPDGQFVLSGGDYSGPEGNYREAILLWDVQTGEVVKSAEPDKWGDDVAYSPDGESIAYIANGEIIIRNVNTWEVVQTFNSLIRPYSSQSLDFSPDGQFIVAGGFSVSENNFIYIWDIQTGENTQALTISGVSLIKNLVYSPDGQFIVSTDEHDDNRIKIWDANTGELVHTLTEHALNYELIYSPDGKFLLTAGTNSARVWDTSTWETIATLSGYNYYGRRPDVTIAYSYDGRFVATAGGDNIKIWDTSNWSEIENIELRMGVYMPQNVVYRPDGVLFRYDVGYFDIPPQDVYVTSINNDEYYSLEWGFKRGFVGNVLFSPNGQILTFRDDKTMVFDAITKEHIFNIDGFTTDYAFSPDSQSIITFVDNSIKIWSTETGELIHTLELDSEFSSCANYSPNGQFIISANYNDTNDSHYVIWDTATNAKLHELYMRSGRCPYFSPDGRTLAFSVGGTIRIWGIPASDTP